MDFKDFFLVDAIEDQAIISKKGDVTYALKIKKSDYNLFVDPIRYEKFMVDFNVSLRLMNIPLICHIQEHYFPQKVTIKQIQQKGKIDSFLQEEEYNNFVGRKYVQSKKYIFLTYQNSNLYQFNFFRKVNTKEIKEKIEIFKEITHKLINRLRSLDVETVLMDKEAILSYYQTYLSLELHTAKDFASYDIDVKNPRFSNKNIEFAEVTEIEHLRDMIPASIAVYNHDGKLTYEVDTATEEAQLFAPLTSPIGIDFDFPHIINNVIYIDHEGLRKELVKERFTAEMILKTFNQSSKLSTDPKIENVNAYLSENLTQCRHHFNVMTIDLKEAENILFEQKMNTVFNGFNKTSEKVEMFFSMLGGCIGYLPIKKYMYSFVEVANLFTNFRGEAENYKKGVIYTDHFNKPIILDFAFDLYDKDVITKRNGFIAGGSGSGKSVNIAHKIRNYLDHQTQVVLVDIGGSFDRLALMYGAKVVKYNPDKIEDFSFGFIYGLSEEIIQDSVKFEFYVYVLLFLLFQGKDSKIEHITLEGLLSQKVFVGCVEIILLEFLKSCNKRTRTFDDFFDFYCHNEAKFTTGDFFDFPHKSVKVVFKKYASNGLYGYLLNSEKETSFLDDKFTYFDFQEVKDNELMMSFMMMNLNNALNSEMDRQSTEKFKAIIFDEVYQFLNNPFGREIVHYNYKTARKHNKGITVGEQEFETILDGPLGKTIVNNSSLIMCPNNPKSMGSILNYAKAMNLTGNDIKMIESMKGRQMFISLENVGSFVVNVEIPKIALATYTTKKSEKKAVLDEIEEAGDLILGLKNYVGKQKKNLN